jgi:magnesium-transporting ATPase (P-type)
MIFSGCINVEGEGVGVVIHTGENMLIASIRDVINKYESK